MENLAKPMGKRASAGLWSSYGQSALEQGSPDQAARVPLQNFIGWAMVIERSWTGPLIYWLDERGSSPLGLRLRLLRHRSEQ